MKKINILYWVFTGLLAAGMIMSSIGSIMVRPDSIAIFKHLGYPEYLVPFMGWAKLLGAVAILVPGFRYLKEWAYAGFFFDLTGAFYSGIAVGDPIKLWLPVMIIGYALIFLSYIYLHKRQKAKLLSGRGITT